MFNSKSNATPLATASLERYNNIRDYRESSHKYDGTFLASVRLLLSNRLKDRSEELVLYTYQNTRIGVYSKETYEAFTTSYDNGKIDYFFNCILPFDTYYNTSRSLNYLVLAPHQEPTSSEYTPLAFIRNNLHKDTNFKRFEAVETYLKQHGYDSVVFNWISNEGYDQIYICVDKTSLKLYHLVQAVLPVLSPDLFEKTPLTKIEKAYLDTLTKDNAVEYERVLKEYCDSMKLEDELLKETVRKLTEYVNSYAEVGLTRSINSANRNIDDCLLRLAELYKDLEMYQAKLLASKLSKKLDDTTLFDYLSGNNSLSIMTVQDSSAIIDVKSYVSNYNQDIFETCVANYGSQLYVDSPDDISAEDKKMFFNAIFDEGKAKIRIGAKIIINFPTDSRIAKLSRYNIVDGDGFYDDTRINNPHIFYYNCFGGNEKEIIKALSTMDITTAFAYCISAVGNINFGDAYVIPKFLQLLFDDSCQCIEYNTELMTAREFIKRLKEGE